MQYEQVLQKYNRNFVDRGLVLAGDVEADKGSWVRSVTKEDISL